MYMYKNMRSLAKAQTAYAQRNIPACQAAHDMCNYVENHERSGVVYRDIVYAGVLSLIIHHNLVTMQTYDALNYHTIEYRCFSFLITYSLTVALIFMIAQWSEKNYYTREKNREAWEYDNHKDGEIREMIELYTSKGVQEQDATRVIHILSRYREFFVDLMMLPKLHMARLAWEDRIGLRTACIGISSVVFGAIPICTTHLTSWARWTPYLVALSVCGILKSLCSIMSWYICVVEMIVVAGTSVLMMFYTA